MNDTPEPSALEQVARLAAAAAADRTPDPKPELEALAGEVARLRRHIGELHRRPAPAPTPDPGPRLEAFGRRLDSLAEQVAALAEQVAEWTAPAPALTEADLEPLHRAIADLKLENMLRTGTTDA